MTAKSMDQIDPISTAVRKTAQGLAVAIGLAASLLLVPETGAIGRDDECAPQREPECDPGQPVNVQTGNVWLNQRDVTMRGRGTTLELVRTYNSKIAYDGARGVFGRGWLSNLEQQLAAMQIPQVLSLRTVSGERIYYQDFDNDGVFRAVIPATEKSWLELGSGGYVRRFISGASQSFDGAGRWISASDPAGNTMAIARDSMGRVTNVSEPGGRALSFQYEGDRISSVSGPLGLIATYQYDSRGFLVDVTYPDQSGYAFTYNDFGQLLTVTDHSGRTLERHEYQGEKGLTSEVGDGQELVRLAYEESHTAVTDGRGHVTVYEYQPIFGRSHLTRVTYPGGETEDWDYDELGRLIRHKNRAGSTTSYEFDGYGRVTAATDELGGKTHYTYTDDHKPETVTAPDGGLTRYTYGPFGPTRTEFTKDGLTRASRIEYDNAGSPTRVMDEMGRVTASTFSPSGDLVTLTDAAGNVIRFEYDAMGRVKTHTKASGAVTTYTYDARGRVLERVRQGEASTRYTYDKGGRILTVTDPMQRATVHSYDSAGRIETVTDPAGGVTRFGYDAMSNLSTITDAEGRTTSHVYDGNNRLTETTFPDGTREVITYDSGGRLKTKTDRRGITTTYTYDAPGRVVRKTYSDGTPTVSFRYDGAGRLLTAADAVDTLSWSYDSLGQRRSETSRRNGSTVSYSYDASGSRIALGLDGVSVAGYAYDAAGRLVSINEREGTYVFDYDADSRRTSLRYPNGVVTRYEYDARDRLATISAASHAPILHEAYTYDLAGARLSKSTDEPETYHYDDRLRLVRVERPGSGTSWTWDYDSVGNRVQEQGNAFVQAYAYNTRNELLSRTHGGTVRVSGQVDEPSAVSLNGVPAASSGTRFEGRLPLGPDNRIDVSARDAAGNETTRAFEVATSSEPESYAYDANGNLTRRTRGAEAWHYEWDAENRLTRVLRNGSEVARFAYDPLGRRVEKVAAGVSHAYTYDGADILRESVTSASGANVVLYIHGPGIDEPLSARSSMTGASTYLHADALGSIVSLTDAGGQVVHRYRYDAWGNIEVGAERSGHAFTGREWDAETGLYYYRARYYDPRSGRFIGEDSFRFNAGVNFYTYVKNVPTALVDPSGHQAHPVSANQNAVAYGYLQQVGEKVLGYILHSAAVPAAFIDRHIFPEHDRDNWFDRALDSLSEREETFVAVAGIVTGPKCPKKWNIDGGMLTQTQALRRGEEWLGPGYRQIQPGIWRSADNTRQFRMRDSDILDPKSPHVHMERIGPDGRAIVENSHIRLSD